MTMTDSPARLATLHRIGPTRPAPQRPAWSAVRVLVADGQTLVRAGFRALLESTQRITVVGEAASGEYAVALARRVRPDVALIDATLPGLDSVEATRQMSKSGVAVMLLTASGCDQRPLDALRAGATGLVLKNSEPAELVRAVAAVARGEALLSPGVTRGVITELASRPVPRPRAENGSVSSRPVSARWWFWWGMASTTPRLRSGSS